MDYTPPQMYEPPPPKPKPGFKLASLWPFFLIVLVVGLIGVIVYGIVKPKTDDSGTTLEAGTGPAGVKATYKKGAYKGDFELLVKNESGLDLHNCSVQLNKKKLLLFAGNASTQKDVFKNGETIRIFRRGNRSNVLTAGKQFVYQWNVRPEKLILRANEGSYEWKMK